MASFRAAPAKITFIQTADLTEYQAMLELTSQTVREYCARRSFTCETFYGIARGFHPWQATYNRVSLLRRLMLSGFGGWAVYMDADAYVFDLDFDLPAYLDGKDDIAFIAAPGAPDGEWWNVNAGVFLLNLAHAKARAIIDRWNSYFAAITDDELRERSDWFPPDGDQPLLWDALRAVPDMQRHVIVDAYAAPPRLFNYSDGLFIRQWLRAGMTKSARMNMLQIEVDRILGKSTASSPSHNPALAHLSEAEQILVSALYRAVFVRALQRPEWAAVLPPILSAQIDMEAALAAYLETPAFRLHLSEFLCERAVPPDT